MFNPCQKYFVSYFCLILCYSVSNYHVEVFILSKLGWKLGYKTVLESTYSLRIQCNNLGKGSCHLRQCFIPGCHYPQLSQGFPFVHSQFAHQQFVYCRQLSKPCQCILITILQPADLTNTDCSSTYSSQLHQYLSFFHHWILDMNKNYSRWVLLKVSLSFKISSTTLSLDVRTKDWLLKTLQLNVSKALLFLNSQNKHTGKQCNIQTLCVQP